MIIGRIDPILLTDHRRGHDDVDSRTQNGPAAKHGKFPVVPDEFPALAENFAASAQKFSLPQAQGIYRNVLELFRELMP